jgi:hypothetical protein
MMFFRFRRQLVTISCSEQVLATSPATSLGSRTPRDFHFAHTRVRDAAAIEVRPRCVLRPIFSSYFSVRSRVRAVHRRW